MKCHASILSLAVLLAACGGDDEVAAPDAAASIDGAVAAHRYFEHVLPDCEPDGLVNCAPSVDFCDDGTVTMLVTDIVNDGTYTEAGDEIVGTFPTADVPETITFTFQGDDHEVLIDDWSSSEWTLIADPEFSRCD